jgi:glycopeptide antibiotics resistance protein
VRLAHSLLGTLLFTFLLVILFVIPINDPHASAGYLREDPPVRAIAIEDIVNVVLLVPFGWGVHRIAREAGMRSPLLAAGIVAAFFSLTIETVQYFLPYRYSSLTDVLANTLGGLWGAWAEAQRTRLSTIVVRVTSTPPFLPGGRARRHQET